MTLTKAEFVMTDAILKLCIGIAAVVLVVLFFAVFIPWLLDFRRELRYLNMEIQRNEGRERAHWEKRKKRLLLSIIPFVRY